MIVLCDFIATAVYLIFVVKCAAYRTIQEELGICPSRRGGTPCRAKLRGESSVCSNVDNSSGILKEGQNMQKCGHRAYFQVICSEQVS